jgi:hypothetical protein
MPTTEKITLFVYGGECQNHWSASWKKVTDRLEKAAELIWNHPDIEFTVIFASGRKTSVNFEKPGRVFMKNYFLKRLEELQDAGKKFTEPQIVLLTNEACSILSETVALLRYAKHHKLTQLWLVYSLSDLLPVWYHTKRLFSSGYGIQYEEAWTPTPATIKDLFIGKQMLALKTT